jgi:hypothetical protein
MEAESGCREKIDGDRMLQKGKIVKRSALALLEVGLFARVDGQHRHRQQRAGRKYVDFFVVTHVMRAPNCARKRRDLGQDSLVACAKPSPSTSRHSC